VTGSLSGKRVAIVATDGFEQAELTAPLNALRHAGDEVDIISPHSGQIQGMEHHEKGQMVTVGRVLGDTRPDDYARLHFAG